MLCYREHGFHISSSWNILSCSSGPLYHWFMSIFEGNYKIIFLTLHVKSLFNHWMVTLAHLNFKNSIFTSFLNFLKIEIYVTSIIITMIFHFSHFSLFSYKLFSSCYIITMYLIFLTSLVSHNKFIQHLLHPILILKLLSHLHIF